MLTSKVIDVLPGWETNSGGDIQLTDLVNTPVTKRRVLCEE